MAHPAIYPKKTFFYPVGNTPAISLTKHLPPEENADILLLGCGDARHIIYTVHSEMSSISTNRDCRMVDVTCCDWEPATLARNAILFTMLSDGIKHTTLWPIFFHFFIDEPSFSLLVEHCEKLVALSSDISTWNASPYGNLVRFCDENSLREVQRKWQAYTQLSNPSSQRKSKAMFTEEMKKVLQKNKGFVRSHVRSAGPLAVHYLPLAHHSYDYFWTHGMVKSPLYLSDHATKVNPTFLFNSMGDCFNVHYGTDPLSGFHLAPAVTSSPDSSVHHSFSLETVAGVALKQFSDQCYAFQERLRLPRPKLIIRLFCGEALAFSRALLVLSQTHSIRTNIDSIPWKYSMIQFSAADYSPESPKRAPLSFNLIDTSNLTDHIGLLNILVTSIPLLQTKPFSTLNTNVLVSHNPECFLLEEKACADLPTLSVFLGVAPTFLLSHGTSASNKHEFLLAASSSGSSESVKASQRHEMVEWRIPDGGIVNRNDSCSTVISSPSCDPTALAQFLFSLYLKMFSTEDMQHTFKAMRTAQTLWSRFNDMSLPLYTRESFVAVLAFLKGNIHTDWNDTMDQLLTLIETDKSLLLGSNYFQDLACHLFLRNIFVFDSFKAPFISSIARPSVFRHWTSIPPVVAVVLKVPRQSLLPLEKESVHNIGTPFLECQTTGPGFDNRHSNIYMSFGDLHISGVGGNARATLAEDAQGLCGISSLVVCFYVPSWIVLRHADTLEFGLCVKSTGQATMHLLPKLGLNLRLFTGRLNDQERVCILRERPGTTNEFRELLVAPPPKVSLDGGATQRALIQISQTGRTTLATNLLIRHDLTDEPAKKYLKEGASVKTSQIGNRFMEIQFQGYRAYLGYPFPILGNKSITRVARKSSYVEVELPMRRNFDDILDPTFNPFPIIYFNNRPCLFNMHYLRLDACPKLDVNLSASKMQWLSIHLGMMMSASERRIQQSTQLSAQGPLINMKQSIGAMLSKWRGFQSPQEKIDVFGLRTNDLGVYALIFINDLRFDLSSHTIVGDGCVIPLIERNLERLTPLLQWVSGPKMMQINTYDDEMCLWHRLLPVLAERCRTWQHTSTCEYLKQGIPRVIGSFENSPLCSCGLGKDLGTFAKKAEYAAGFSEATRIALGPIFTHSSMDDVIAQLKGGSEARSPPQTRQSDNRSSSPSSSLQCAYCNGEGKPTLLVCSGCKLVKYCTRECQKRDWRGHKRDCKV
ncbi:hypothetical protein CVT24_011853 [Panaeolus cyanescens]|uniref:MYND-type domain-containing protein n=1 Tax=Panaeolus cyanescens TaxID=181874 RepID=A0A409YNN7_9AGAR|nr:hypothetical protein CVT24_011853 [Panaeolus cyanescens]